MHGSVLPREVFIQAELEWLKVQERDLKSKGADEQMPPLRKREQGLLKKLQQEQVRAMPYMHGVYPSNLHNVHYNGGFKW